MFNIRSVIERQNIMNKDQSHANKSRMSSEKEKGKKYCRKPIQLISQNDNMHACVYPTLQKWKHTRKNKRKFENE